ncbi:unnamed protein product [Blepharisma stoltei]|uniref:Phosphatase 2A Regulatory Subunit A helical domain-containing protein n=1 Tax=Blepharisma stoltei TaxID=1481888 RepID=A0AAU9K390_9CILI|nr:unnamed protein product [Blepharisma stoltei]
MSNSEESSLYPIAVLIDELRSDEISRRINSIKNLRTIATALGYERTRTELIPYLSELIDDEEQVLLSLSEILPTMIDCVGGKYFAHVLFDPLELLCQVEDSSVRASAVQSFKTIFNQLDMPLLEPALLDMIKRMNDGDYFTSKSGAAMAISVCIGSMSNEGKTAVLEIFKGILENNQPQVRKSAAENLKFLPNVCISHENVLIECLRLITNDKEDTVRLLTVENLIEFCKFYPENIVNASIIPMLRVILEDKSWKIRYMLCDKIAELGECLSNEHRTNLLCPYYIKFLQDPETEVRTMACTRLAEFGKLLPIDQMIIILQILSPLTADVDSVKIALASNINKVSPIIGKANTEMHIVKILNDLSKDPSPDLRMCLFSDLESLGSVVGFEIIGKHIIPALQELSEDKQWRIRIRAADTIPILGRQLGLEFFSMHLDSIMKKLLNDSVFSVRESIIKGYKELSELYGSTWAEAKISEEIAEFQASESYLRRMTMISMVKAFLSKMSEEKILAIVVPMIVSLSSDAVPNIRLNIARLIKEVFPLVTDASTKDRIKAILKTMSRDDDVDVKFYSDLSLKAFG